MKKIIFLYFFLACHMFNAHAQDNALNFATAADFVSLGTNFGSFGTNDFTVETWFKTSGTSYQPILVKGPTGGACAHQNFWAISIIANGTLRFEVDGNTSGLNYGIASSPLAYNNNQWHHVACTRNGTTIKMYVDGSLVASAVTAGVTNLIPNGSAEIGRGYCGHFNGTIDEMRVWNYARSATEISESFAVPTIYPQTGLVNYLDFNFGTAAGNNSGQNVIIDRIAPFSSYSLFFFTLSGASSNWVANTRTTISSLGSSGAATGSNLVINGTNLSGATAATVKVGGVPVHAIVSNTGTSLVVIGYTASSGKVTVTTPTGGTASSTTNFTYTYVTPQNALNFDGVNDFINLPAYPGTFYTNDFTVESWFNTTSAGANMPIISKRPSCGASNFWNITIASGHVVWEQYQNAAGVNTLSLSTALTYNNGQWHHVAVTRSGTLVKMYIDGNFILSGNSAAVTNLNDSITTVQIGHSPCGYYSGTIDEVRIWNVAKTAAEISSNYKLPLTLPQADLRSYINFNQGIPGGNNSGLTSVSDGNGLTYPISNFALNGATSNYVANTISAIPTISGVNNTLVCGANSLSILGSNFTGLTPGQISIGGVAVSSIVSNSGTALVVMPTLGSNGTIQLSTLSGSALSTNVITVASQPIITNISAPAAICLGQSANINITSDIPCSFNWNPGNINGGSISVSPTAATTYTVTASSIASGCTAIGTKTIAVNASPIITSVAATPSTICVGASSVLSFPQCDNISNFTSSYAIGNWTTSYSPANVGGSVVTTNAPSSVSLMSGDNSIQGSLYYDVTIPTSGVISFNWQYNTQDGSTYDYPLISLNGNTPSYLAGYNLFGSVSQSGSQSIAVNAGDVMHWIAYTTDGIAGGCTTAYSNLLFTPSCPTQTITWNPGSLNGATQTISPLTSTTYTITVTNTNNCSATATQLVTVNALPVISSITATPAAVCIGSSSVLNVNPPCSSFTSFTGPFSISNWNLNTIGNGGGSINTSAAPNSITFYYPQAQATLYYDVTIPEDGIISFDWAHHGVGAVNNVTPGYQLNTPYATLFSGYNQSALGNQNGTQTLNVSAGNVLHLVASNYGAGNTDSWTISNFHFTTNCTNTISWNMGSLSGSSPTVTPTTATTYTATVTSTNGCSNTSNVTVTINPSPVINTISASPSAVCPGSNSVVNISTTCTSITNFTDAFAVTNWSMTNSTGSNGSVNTSNAPNSVDLIYPDNNGVAATTLFSIAMPGTGVVTFNWEHTTSLPFLMSTIYPNISLNNNPAAIFNGFNQYGSGNQTGTQSINVTAGDVLNLIAFNAVGYLSGAAITQISNIQFTPNCTNTMSWNPGSLSNASMTVTPTTATTYTATVTNANGCTTTSNVTVNIKPTPIIDAVSATPSSICAGGNSMLTVSASCPPILNFTGDYALSQWTINNSPGSNGIVDTTGAPNSVQLIYPDNNGVASTTILSKTFSESGVVTFSWSHSTWNTLLQPYIYPNISLNNNPAFIINGFNQYGGGIQSGSQTLTVNAGDIVNIIAFNAYGFPSGNAVTTISNFHFTPNCSNVVWNPGLLNGAIQTVTPSATTIYTVTALASNGCTATSSQTVTVSPLPNVIASASVTSLCPTSTNSLHFDGVDDYISQPTAIDAGSGTWEAWVKKENWADHHDDRLFGNGFYFETNNAFYISLHPAVGFHFRYGGTLEPNNVYTSSGNTFSFAPNSWHHLAATWKNDSGITTIALYIDGVQVSSTSTPLLLNVTAPTYLGGDANFPKFGPGNLEEVRLWNVARTPAEIAANLNRNTLYPQLGLYSLFTFDPSMASGNNASLSTLTDPVTPSTISTLNNFSLNGNTSNFVSDSRLLSPNLTLTGIGATSYVWSSGVNNGQTFLPTISNTYTVTGTDANGCSATSDVTVNTCAVNLDLKAYLQGYYQSAGLMTQVLYNQGIEMNVSTTNVDSISVELRENSVGYPVVANFNGLLQLDGILACTFPSSALGKSCYIIIKHRGSIETWSANPIMVAPSNTYDFTIATGQAYGDNQVLIETTPSNMYAIYSGDINADENTDLLDASDLETDINNFEYGYKTTDLNGDGNVDLLDSPILEENINLFIFSYHP